jgi:hypothetical protein
MLDSFVPARLGIMEVAETDLLLGDNYLEVLLYRADWIEKTELHHDVLLIGHLPVFEGLRSLFR